MDVPIGPGCETQGVSHGRPGSGDPRVVSGQGTPGGGKACREKRGARRPIGQWGPRAPGEEPS